MTDPHTPDQPAGGPEPPAGGGPAQPGPSEPGPARPGSTQPGAAQPGPGQPPPEPAGGGSRATPTEPLAGSAEQQPAPEPDAEVVEGEVVDSMANEADAILAEALDAEAIEAEFSAAEADLAAVEDGSETVSEQVATLTADLQRVHAEYSNYRKRVERDRQLVRERAVEGVLTELLPILDDIGRARSHDELVGGFRSVGEALEATASRLGLTPFGESGEPFDPIRHEALMREEREGVTEPTIVTVLQVGYEMNGRVVRPARVSVAGTG